MPWRSGGVAIAFNQSSFSVLTQKKYVFHLNKIEVLLKTPETWKDNKECYKNSMCISDNLDEMTNTSNTMLFPQDNITNMKK